MTGKKISSPYSRQHDNGYHLSKTFLNILELQKISKFKASMQNYNNGIILTQHHFKMDYSFLSFCKKKFILMRHKEFLKYSFKFSFSPMLLFEFYFKIILKLQYVYDIFQICELYSTLA